MDGVVLWVLVGTIEGYQFDTPAINCEDLKHASCPLAFSLRRTAPNKRVQPMPLAALFRY
jgi:hypothetical protein